MDNLDKYSEAFNDSRSLIYEIKGQRKIFPENSAPTTYYNEHFVCLYENIHECMIAVRCGVFSSNKREKG